MVGYRTTPYLVHEVFQRKLFFKLLTVVFLLGEFGLGALHFEFLDAGDADVFGGLQFGDHVLL